MWQRSGSRPRAPVDFPALFPMEKQPAPKGAIGQVYEILTADSELADEAKTRTRASSPTLPVASFT